MQTTDRELPALLQELITFYAAQGYELPPTVGLTDHNKPFRFDPDDPRGDRCWIYIHALNHSSKPGQFLVATLGDWRDPDLRVPFKSEMSYDAADKASIAAQLAHQKKKANKAKEEEQKRAREAASRLFGKGEKREHPYLKYKGLTGMHGTLVNAEDNALMVPMRNTSGSLCGIQRIYNSGKEKRFLSGQKKDGTFHCIPDSVDPLKETTLILCEGFATGASIFEATGRTVIVCFDAGNLVKVAKALYMESPEAAFIIAGDDDRYNDTNTGAEHAEKARILCGGTVVLPRFPHTDEDSTDFNDLATVSGHDTVRDQIEDAIKRHRPQYVRCLGFNDGQHFFTSSDNKSLIQIAKPGQMELLSMMPIQYWEGRYPGKKGGVDWTLAASDLMDRCRKAGQYSMENTRGRGVWLDDNELVVHMGDRLWVRGREIGLHDLKSSYVYVTDQRMERIHPMPLTLDECAMFLDAVNGLRVRDEWSKMFIVGWPVQALLGGALRWRTHLHITGDSGAGKSTILDRVIWPLVSIMGLQFQGNSTTESGLRNSVGSGSLAIVVDELESDNKASMENIKALLNYMRACSSGGKITKGTTGGRGVVNFSAYSTFCLASIQDILKRQSDSTRTVQVHLKKNTHDPEQWPRVERLIYKLEQGEYAERMFSRMVNRYAQFKESLDTFFRVISEKEDARIASLYSALLAGWNVIESDEAISEARAIVVFARVQREKEKATSQLGDWEVVMNRILTTRVDLSTPGRATVESLLDTLGSQDDKIARDTLASYGLKVVVPHGHTEQYLFVRNEHAEIQRILRQSGMDEAYDQLLKRAPGAIDTRQSIDENGRTHKRLGTLIPLKRVLGRS